MLAGLKTFEILTEETEKKLIELQINNNPGGIARLFLNIVNEEIATAYETLSQYHANAFVSTASETALDAIGSLMNCQRLLDEDDEAYRLRITKQSLQLATANQTAIRLAALSVDGVVDVVMKSYVYGTGSFSLLVLADAINAPEDVMERVREVTEPLIGYGIRYEIIQPTFVPVTFQVKLLLKETVDPIKAQEIRLDVREALRTYFLSRTIAEPLEPQEITQRIMEVHDGIVSFVCERMTISGETRFFVQQTAAWNERFVLSQEEDGLRVL